MTLNDVVWVFDGWDPARDYPDQVGEIWCCGRHVAMHDARIVCDLCGTIVEQVNGAWRVVQLRGMVQQNGWIRVCG